MRAISIDERQAKMLAAWLKGINDLEARTGISLQSGVIQLPYDQWGDEGDRLAVTYTTLQDGDEGAVRVQGVPGA